MKKWQKLIGIFYCFSLGACSNAQDVADFKLEGSSYDLVINKANFRFYFTDKEGNIVVPPHSTSGLKLNDGQVINSEAINDEGMSVHEKRFKVSNARGETTIVNVSFQDDIAKFVVQPISNHSTNIGLRLGGMSIAHGLGDAGFSGEYFNLVKNVKNSYPIINNGGNNRWTSTFAIFPKNDLAGVYFDFGKKSVTTNLSEYSMNITTDKAVSFYYILGKPKSIYRKYKTLRTTAGFEDVKPKYPFFELGWESWDALGWNVNQVTVREVLQKFIDNGYPIKWAVTGSGFWENGGTTTSFGKWGKSFSDHAGLKEWMNANDIKWIIGLRTNFVPGGGPYYPMTEKRDRNLKVKKFNGNILSEEALEKGFLVNKSGNNTLKITSRIFPIVPCYLLDGEAKGAAAWFADMFKKWDVDGIKEDTMMDIDSLTHIFNKPIRAIANQGDLVMARNGNFASPGTLLRINDTRVKHIQKRIPVNYFQYAASGCPNVYSDVAGVHNMHKVQNSDLSIRHAWLLSMTAGMAVGVYPEKWDKEHQDIFKKIAKFHHDLSPYLYDAAIQSYNTGFPYTLTPFSIAFSEDPLASELSHFQWMIGESILAVPLLKNYKSKAMDVYLPAGVWYDYENDKKYTGPVLLKDFEMELSKTPCFIGGKGVIFKRNAHAINAHVYPLEKNVSLTFTYPGGKNESKIVIKDPDWQNATIINTTTNQEILYERKGIHLIFELQKNHHYVIK